MFLQNAGQQWITLVAVALLMVGCGQGPQDDQSAASASGDDLVGTWQIDMEMTVGHHFDEVAAGQPEFQALSPAALAAEKAALLAQVRARAAQNQLIFDGDTFTSVDPRLGSVTRPYKVVASSADRLVVQAYNPAGQPLPAVTTVHLVASGIAVETVDCVEHADQCDQAVRVARSASAAQPSPLVTDLNQPRLAYFVRVD